MTEIPLFVTSENTSSERRINPSWTIKNLRVRLETITGIPPANQQIQLYGASKISKPIIISAADEDTTTLEGFSLEKYGRINVDDTRPLSNRPNFTDTTNVEFYTMPNSVYEKRTDSVLAWKKQNHLGRFAEENSGDEANGLTKQQEQEKLELLSIATRGIKVGARCIVINPVEPNGPERRGTVRYIGKIPEIKSTQINYWVGVEYDEPLGKNDGSLEGTRYFDAKKGCGSFVKPEIVQIGDYPEENLFSDDEI
ncbi:uncharacterized protein SAPINGB_P003728 [Magnusiomyces paraingens]|uniref:CAP-Gly domain-containing protein n=1 Tax=Magnusiomyces paraingens TaxID=2606893 RepID=A0A5E8BYA9_9ASCO|nr:uncharacterized protein SAPINGB_P003728 [Saprochaete ingens]VVT53745.1 unnamed protein product [Saprochaete ingens]